MLDRTVLVLNQNYLPLNVCNARRALTLLDRGKAEIIEPSQQVVRSTYAAHELPSVIRLVYMIKRPIPQVRLTRKEVFLRDQWTCQYCGIRTHDLTLDHVVPRQRGGPHTWDNLVSACRSCNHRKGNRTPAEAHMLLQRQPARPRTEVYYTFNQYLDSKVDWRPYIPGYTEPARIA